MNTDVLIGILDACKSRGVSSIEWADLKVTFFDDAIIPVALPSGPDRDTQPLNDERSVLERVAARSLER